MPGGLPDVPLCPWDLRVQHHPVGPTRKEELMSRVLGVHEIQLKPGTDPEEFERAAAEVAS